MFRNRKFRKKYRETREYLSKINEKNYKAVLNTLYHVYPISFEKKGMQDRIRSIYQKYITPVDLFHLNMARLYRQGKGTKVAICCMPKSGSTYFLSSLARLEGEKFKIAYLQTPYGNPSFVGSLTREHEIDELALMILEMQGGNWVSHMHTKSCLYTERMFEAHNIRPILTVRNIFDCIVSMDDMLMAQDVEGFPMIRLPKSYFETSEQERLSFLCRYVGPWYIDFIVSWSRTKLDHLRLNYEDDVLGFDEKTASKLREFLGLQSLPIEAFHEAFDLKDKKRQSMARLNKGVSGRGENIPQEDRDYIRKLATIYENEVDFTGLL